MSRFCRRLGFGGELAEGLQGADGGEEEGLVARPFLAAGGGLDGLLPVFLRWW